MIVLDRGISCFGKCERQTECAINCLLTKNIVKAEGETMRLVTFLDRPPVKPEKPRIGALVHADSAVVDLTTSLGSFPEYAGMLELIRAGRDALNRARDTVLSAAASGRGLISRESVDLLAPLTNPPLMRDWGMMTEHMMFFVREGARPSFAGEADPEAALEKAIAEGKIGLPENYFTVPRFYTCNPLNVMGHEAILEWPVFCEVLDYELEIGLVIGKTGKNVPEDKAGEYMFGLTLFNDFTARDVQAAEGTPAGKSKDFDGSYSLGPCIATIDEFENIYDIKTRLRLNGEQQTESSTSTMRITFERLISYMSEGCTLHAGEIFGSGTFENGCGTEKGRLLQEGDFIELEADGIGTLRNEIGRKK